MFRGVHSSPICFAQAFKIEDGQRLPCFERIAEKVRDLLGNGSVKALGPSLKLFVKGVRKVFDIQDGHFVPPKYLHYGGIIAWRQRRAWRLDSLGRRSVGIARSMMCSLGYERYLLCSVTISF
jgi:hypothetical protein